MNGERKCMKIMKNVEYPVGAILKSFSKENLLFMSTNIYLNSSIVSGDMQKANKILVNILFIRTAYCSREICFK